MITIKTLQVALAAAIVAMAAGCANDQLIEPTTPDTPQGELMSITVGMPADDAQTRVAFDGANLSLKWQQNDKITVSRNGQSSDFSIDNISTDGKSATFSGTPPDQSGTGNYTIAYTTSTNAMTGQAQTANKSTAHLKEYIRLEAIVANPNTDFTLAMKSSIMKFILSGTILADIGTLKQLIWRAEGTDQFNSLTMNIEGCAFDGQPLTAFLSFMPQEMPIKAGGKFIVELIGSSKRFKAVLTLPRGKTYEAGTQYTAIIQGAAGTASWTELLSAKVGDFYYKDGTWSPTYTKGDANPCIGIVFVVNTDGYTGKIVDLKEPPSNWNSKNNNTGCLMWGPSNSTTTATNELDGLKNMEAIKTVDGTFSTFPAFEWAHAKNAPTTNYSTTTTGVWYLPAKKELKQLYAAMCGLKWIASGMAGPDEIVDWTDNISMPNYANYEGAYDAFNAKLEAAGGTKINYDARWSSTKSNEETKALTFNFNGGSLSETIKEDENTYVRAIYAF